LLDNSCLTLRHRHRRSVRDGMRIVGVQDSQRKRFFFLPTTAPVTVGSAKSKLSFNIYASIKVFEPRKIMWNSV
jgi:hypothetical protein